MPPRRSCLAVPGSQPRFHERAGSSGADMVFFDLEDSVAPSAKPDARELVVSALRAHRYPGMVRAVRVNGVDTAWCLDDVSHVVEGAGAHIDTLILPKVEDPATVHFAHHLLDQLERRLELERAIGLELQIESARGLEQVERIAAASPRNQTLIFGPVDLAASLRLPGLRSGDLREAYPGDFWHHFLVRILVAARANGLQAIDGPYVVVRDGAGLRKLAERSAMLGYDGKWAVHPSQVAILNQVYAPSQADFDRAHAILDAYRRATDERATGAIMLGDEMLDEASRRLALVTLERGRALGMQPTFQASAGRPAE